VTLNKITTEMRPIEEYRKYERDVKMTLSAILLKPLYLNKKPLIDTNTENKKTPTSNKPITFRSF
jgi:hypothetical protein